MNNPLTDSVGIEYLDFYYCAMKPRGLQALALVVLALALSFLFCGLATASSDFFCPNLGALAEYFNLPDDVAGVGYKERKDPCMLVFKLVFTNSILTCYGEKCAHTDIHFPSI